jgi:hypothetical protein
MIIPNWSAHKKRCKGLGEAELLKNQVAQMKEQLATNHEHYQKELAAKDEQIRELIQVAKKPRTVNHTTNNRYVVEQHINVFGKESLEHIRPEQIESLLADPANAVSRYIKLKHQKAPGAVNANVRVPNQKRAIYQVVVGAAGLEGEEEKEWENRAKGEVLEQMYDENSGHLEAEADEETRVGSQFLEHQDLVRASAEGVDGGRRYKEQLDKIHMVVAN